MKAYCFCVAQSLTTLMWALVRMHFQPQPRLLQVLAATVDQYERSDQLVGVPGSAVALALWSNTALAKAGWACLLYNFKT